MGVLVAASCRECSGNGCSLAFELTGLIGVILWSDVKLLNDDKLVLEDDLSLPESEESELELALKSFALPCSLTGRFRK